MAAKKFIEWATENKVDLDNPVFIRCWSAAIKFAEENFSAPNTAGLKLPEMSEVWSYFSFNKENLSEFNKGMGA